MVYEIVIDGYVKESRFNGLKITRLCNATTALQGDIADQSALMGILRAINDLGIDLISVSRIEQKADENCRRIGGKSNG